MERRMREKGERIGVGSSRVMSVGGAYHGKFCSSDLSAEWEPSSIMYIMDP